MPASQTFLPGWFLNRRCGALPARARTLPRAAPLHTTHTPYTYLYIAHLAMPRRRAPHGLPACRYLRARRAACVAACRQHHTTALLHYDAAQHCRAYTTHCARVPRARAPACTRTRRTLRACLVWCPIPARAHTGARATARRYTRIARRHYCQLPPLPCPSHHTLPPPSPTPYLPPLHVTHRTHTAFITPCLLPLPLPATHLLDQLGWLGWTGFGLTTRWVRLVRGTCLPTYF